MEDIPEDVRKFIDRYVDSLERLEVLVLLQREPQRQWTSSAVAAALNISTAAADQHLAKLCSDNLLDVRIGKDLFYWFNPRPPHLERAAAALGRAYETQRLALYRQILDRPAEPIRDFAEAFRLSRKGNSDG